MKVDVLFFADKYIFVSYKKDPSLIFYLFNIQIGHDKEGLPIGLQLIGRPWGEASILRVASALEVLSFSTSMECAKFMK